MVGKQMIDIKKLDNLKTYCIYVIGSGLISKLIQKVSKKETEKLSNLNLDKTATHVAMLYFTDDWYIFESHAKYTGTRKILFTDWMKDEKQKEIFCFEHNFDVQIMEHYIKFNPGYSIADISRFAFDNFTNAKPQDIFNNNPGIVCSEYAALCTISNSKNICDFFELPTFQIKPLHFQILGGIK